MWEGDNDCGDDHLKIVSPPDIMGSAGGCGDLESWDDCFHLGQQILSEYKVVTRFMLDFHF